MTLEERKADAEQRRNAQFAAMQEIASRRNALNDQLAQGQIALTKIDGELELIDRMIKDA